MKNRLAVLVALLIMSSTGFAVQKCSLLVSGSYVHQLSAGPHYMDELTLAVDGTAYFYQSSSFDFALTQGVYIPAIGSWTCLSDGSVLVTTIASNYAPNGSDLNLLNNLRQTIKLSVIDSNTLQQTARSLREIPLADDPLGNTGTVASSCSGNCGSSPFKRVRPIASDLP
jgi:hypothetical protein